MINTLASQPDALGFNPRLRSLARGLLPEVAFNTYAVG